MSSEQASFCILWLSHKTFRTKLLAKIIIRDSLYWKYEEEIFGILEKKMQIYEWIMRYESILFYCPELPQRRERRRSGKREIVLLSLSRERERECQYEKSRTNVRWGEDQLSQTTTILSHLLASQSSWQQVRKETKINQDLTFWFNSVRQRISIPRYLQTVREEGFSQ